MDKRIFITEEEVRRITNKTLDRLRSMITEPEDERTPQEKVNEIR